MPQIGRPRGSRNLKPKPPGWVNPAKGKPNGRARPIAERFWEHVEKSAEPDGCWIWTGPKDYREVCPYGRFQIFDRRGRGKKDGQRLRKMAHRVSWEDVHQMGTIPQGMTLDHICKNTLCVRPGHLRLATPRENFVEYSTSPSALNAKKTACHKGHPLDGENLALYRNPKTHRLNRVCLTCHPTYWRHAVVPRARPPGTRVKKTDPDYQGTQRRDGQ